MLRFRRRSDDASEPEDDGAEGSVADELVAIEQIDDSSGGSASFEAEEEHDETEEGHDAPGELEESRRSLRSRLGRSVGAPFRSLRRKGRVDDQLLAELEDALLIADVGLPTTTKLLDRLRLLVKEREFDDPIEALREIAVDLFSGDDRELHQSGELSVWLFVGVNGAGKTTTIGKLAYRESRRGERVVVAAGDTFRAAAVDQLDVWAQRAGVAIVEGGEGADPASVVFDAKQHAAARGATLVLADTAGRLHTKANLMAELQKVRRVADRPPGEVTEVLLVLDATTGQNGLAQARQFTDTAGVTGIVLTKLDGSAKGGVVLAIRSELGVPIKLVGVGEGIDDLIPFDPEEFVAALLDSGE